MPQLPADMARPTKTYHTQSYDRIAKHHGFDGQGKTILITGGASGVGYQLSEAFASAGAFRIAIISRSVEAQAKAREEIESLYPTTKVLTFQASITDMPRITAIVQELGTIDVLVLNAAVTQRRVPGTELTMEEVQEIFDINVIGQFALTKTYLSMEAPKLKTILNITSAAVQMSGHGFSAYGPSKAATVQVMRNFADEASQRNEDVKIITFHPGAIWTAMTEKHSGDILPKDSPIWEDPHLPGDFALWLAGPESGFLHGRYVWANWDVDELIGIKEKIEKDSGFLRVGLVLREFDQVHNR
ncbi:putative short-chain dehydrogenase [Rhypophila sp. PSN 637]